MDGDAIVEISARMIASAIEGDWEEVERLTGLRDRHMRECDPAVLAPLLVRLAEDNERLMSLALKARTASRDALGRLRRGRRAANVYAESGNRIR